MAPELLGQVDLAGWVVTGDALYAQKNLSRQVVEQGGDYFWVVKDNQPTLRADIALLFAEPPWGEELATAGECGRHGDRWEERTLWTSTALNEYLDWPQVRQVCCVERKVTRKLDFTQNPGKVMDDITFVRSHWWLVSEGFSLSTANSDVQKLPATLYHRIAVSLAYAA